ncbi:MAG: imidazolonepropionase [Anaerolineae bacterium]
MLRVDTLIDNAQVATLAGGHGPLAGRRQGDLGLIDGGAVAVERDRIAAVGPRDEVLRRVTPTAIHDAGGRLVTPGLVDAHTHLVWAGERAAEFELRIGGASYLEIMEAGGGIASTVRHTRAASDDELLAGVISRLDRMMAHGTTTTEAKSGYGLDTREELRQLAVLRRADAEHPVRIARTFIGAHAVPDEYRGRQEDYVDLVVEEMLPEVARRNPGVFCDVFCDDGAFTIEQTERVLTRAAELGLPLKVHSDEFANLGCTALAARLGAVSADHLAVTSPAEMEAMAASGTVAVLLPGTTFGLGSSHYADARAMVERGVPVALGTDLNPGTCPCESLPFMMALATRYMRLTPAEALVAVTRNAAAALGRGDDTGRLEEGGSADLVVMDTADYRDLSYRFGGSPAAAVMIGGRWTYGRA